MYKIFTTIIIILLSAAACNQNSPESFSIDNAWVREAPPNATAMAGYVTIKNNTQQKHILSYAKSAQFNQVEIHRTIIENGVAKMRRQNNLPIPADGSLILEPGSYHLMLLTPKSPLKANDEVTVTIGLKMDDKVEEMDILMPVKKAN